MQWNILKVRMDKPQRNSLRDDEETVSIKIHKKYDVASVKI